MSKHFTRAQVGQALECAYIETSELEEVIDNVLVLLRDAWDAGNVAGSEDQAAWNGNWYAPGHVEHTNPYEEATK